MLGERGWSYGDECTVCAHLADFGAVSTECDARMRAVLLIEEEQGDEVKAGAIGYKGSNEPSQAVALHHAQYWST